mmetsp:Transcript_41972/g.98902  ORF Transcript_41972/g.98902 Transcript_41972/m.98902 type:complete len:209 (-) Transcript_41972:321-947(-)
MRRWSTKSATGRASARSWSRISLSRRRISERSLKTSGPGSKRVCTKSKPSSRPRWSLSCGASRRTARYTKTTMAASPSTTGHPPPAATQSTPATSNERRLEPFQDTDTRTVTRMVTRTVTRARSSTIRSCSPWGRCNLTTPRREHHPEGRTRQTASGIWQRRHGAKGGMQTVRLCNNSRTRPTVRPGPRRLRRTAGRPRSTAKEAGRP